MCAAQAPHTQSHSLQLCSFVLYLCPKLVWEPFHGTLYHESILTLTLILDCFHQCQNASMGPRTLLPIHCKLHIFRKYQTINMAHIVFSNAQYDHTCTPGLTRKDCTKIK